MANSKQKTKFSDGKLFWMALLALLLSITALVIMTFYIALRAYNDKSDVDITVKYQTQSNELKFCYNNDIKPCTPEAIQEFNKRNNYQ